MYFTFYDHHAFTVIFVVCRDFLLSQQFCITAVKIDILCVILAFEWSLMCTRKSCCGLETALCRCKIQYVSKFTAATRGSPCDADSTAFVYSNLSSAFVCLQAQQ